MEIMPNVSFWINADGSTKQVISGTLTQVPMVEERIKILTDADLPYENRYPQCYTAPGFDERAKRFQQWCKENKVYYYARPRESFSKLEAYREADKAGCTSMILEDMS